MISLDIQIKSLIFSFLYGVFFSIILNVNYKFVFESKGIKKILINIFFIIDNVLLYFIILRFINNGIIHFYFVLALFMGYICVNKVASKIRFLIKYWFLVYWMI